MKPDPPTNNDTPQKQSFDWSPKHFSSAEELIDVAGEYFATDFSNPEHRECPAAGILQSIVNSSQMPTAELRAHLFGCSECFCEYREAVQRRRQLIVASSNWWHSLIAALPQWRAALIAGAIVLLTLSAGIFIWSSHKESAPQISQSRPQPEPSSNIVSTAPTGADVKQPIHLTPKIPPKPTTTVPSTARQKSKIEDLLAINIDLNDYSLSREPRHRGVGGTEEKAIKLPKARVLLGLMLSLGSAPGYYRVSIVDDYVRPVVPGKAFSPDGSRLTAKLDLRRLTKRFYRLRLVHGDEAPDFYQIEIDTP